MRYDEQIIEQVRNANDIVDVIGQHVRLTRKGAYYFGLCPFHGEKTASFSVSPGKQIFHCFGCGAGGNVISFLMQYENYSFQEALKALADRAHISLPEASFSEDKEKKELKASLLQINKEAAVFYNRVLKSTEGNIGLEYFKKRALSDRTITHFGLGFSPKASDALYRHLKEKGYTDDIIKESGLVIYSEKGAKDRFWNRVIFPIMDTNNRVIAFGGRVLGDGLPKYLNSSESLIFDKSATLYGLNFAKKSKRKYLLLCEGYMDVIALHQAGFDNAVASLGTAFNEKHARLLKRYTDTVILTQDSDTAGTNAKIKAFPILYSAGLNVKVLEIEGAKDPDELIRLKGADAYERFISEAKNGFLFMIEVLRREYNLSDPAEKTAFYNAVAEKLCMFKESLERANYTDSVSTSFMIDRDELKRMVEKRFELGGTAASGVMPSDRPENGEKRKTSGQQTKDNSGLKYEMLLISWLCERTELSDAVFKHIEPEQFNTPVLRKLAVKLKNKEIIDEAGFLDEMQPVESDLKLAAEAFALGESQDGIKNLSKTDIEKGLTEAVRALRYADIDRRKKEVGSDLLKLGQLIKEKNELLKLYVRIEDEAVKET